MPIIIAMSVERTGWSPFRLFALAKTQEGHPPGLRFLEHLPEQVLFTLPTETKVAVFAPPRRDV